MCRTRGKPMDEAERGELRRTHWGADPEGNFTWCMEHESWESRLNTALCEYAVEHVVFETCTWSHPSESRQVSVNDEVRVIDDENVT